MKTLIAICGVLLLAACSTMPQRAVPESLFSDAAFGEAPTELQTLDLFALSPAMRDFLLQDAPKYTRRDGPSRGLYEAMRTRLNIDYDASNTHTPAETLQRSEARPAREEGVRKGRPGG